MSTLEVLQEPPKRKKDLGQRIGLLGAFFFLFVCGCQLGPHEELADDLEMLDLTAVRRAVVDMIDTFGEDYARGPEYLAQLDAMPPLHSLIQAVKRGDEMAMERGHALLALAREALLANPLLDFDRLLLRAAHRESGEGFHANFSTPVRIRPDNWDTSVFILSNLRGDPELEPLFRPAKGRLVRDLDLEFDGDRFLFSTTDSNNRWAVYEMTLADQRVQQVSPSDFPDVDWFQGIYLPDGRILLSSTASYGTLDCVGGSQPMSDFYLLDRASGHIRQLTFDQINPNYPAVMNDGRILYQRWEYSDLPHYFSRILFTMNPDGTTQAPYYGSGSYFPTAFTHARPVPDHPRLVVGIVGGHHGVGEMGRLALIDPGLARHYPFIYEHDSKEWSIPVRGVRRDSVIKTETLPAAKTGFVQEIPGFGKDVVGHVADYQVQYVDIWPRFTHPFPLSEKYFISAMRRSGDTNWGIYLVDVFDNMTLIKELPDTHLLEPIPLQARPRPPVIPDRVNLEQDHASVLVQDVYAGPGLEGVPRGTVDRLRIFAYHFAFNETGNHHALGPEGPWDVRRMLGTVPVEKDGSAHFNIPANTPISIQPLDADGRALQLMRSWLVGMPGERVSCVGCHESMSTAPPARLPRAALGAPRDIEEWYGPARPYSFVTEVQPVLDRYCIGCHDGTQTHGGKELFSLKEPNPQIDEYTYRDSTSYRNLHPYVRRPGPESDLRMFVPLEYHANTSPLIQMLEKGHHGVELSAEAWERLFTWIDLNAPHGGRWNPEPWRGQDQVARRLELAGLFGAPTVNPEAEASAQLIRYKNSERPEPLRLDPVPPPEPDGLETPGFPFDAETAVQLQAGAGATERTIELAPGVELVLKRITAGQFIMGALDGFPDEYPRAVVEIEQPFWMGTMEISNHQYRVFDPEHDTGYHAARGKDQHVPGYIGNHRNQPVARVSWQQAMAFCDWLSERTGLNVTLPTEAQWEWAARAGTQERFFFGDENVDYSRHANLAGRDAHIFLRDRRFSDGARVANYVGQYAPNAWGLHDMIGNVSEWTRSLYRPYPYQAEDGRNERHAAGKRVARGGSWHERPRDVGAAVRVAYPPYQRVFNVGFRIIVED